MTTMVPEDAPKPRVCHVKKWADFNGYGFNLHAEKGKAGQFIGKVDSDSPADLAGMKEGDRIVEVNGVNISNENHQQVVTRIKHDPNATSMLLLDSETDNYYKDRKIVVRGDMPNVMIITCPDTSDGTATVVEGGGNSTPSTPSTVETPSRPRLCALRIWPDFQGYGFNLHAEKGKPGQFIGKVDAGSPSEVAGLKEGDRILEVNGNPVAQDSHAQVVQKIKSRDDQTDLLVVDKEADEYYKDRGIVVDGGMSDVERIECPVVRPEANGSAAQVEAEMNHHDQNDDYRDDDDIGDYETPDVPAIAAISDEVNGDDEVAAALSSVDQAVEDEEKPVEDAYDGNYESVVPHDTPPREPSPEPVRVPTPEPVVQASVPLYDEPRDEEPVTPTSPGPVTVGGIEFAGSIEEARQRASRKKKKDPRIQQQLSMKDKYDMFMKM